MFGVLLVWFALIAPAFANGSCGGEKQRECQVWEQVPSCDAMHTAVSGKCYHCGREGEPACAVTVRVPSCDDGLDEVAGRCVGSCGKRGEAICPVHVMAGGCERGLVGLSGHCVDCGAANEPLCPINDDFDRCDPYHTPVDGLCQVCGKGGQRPCVEPITREGLFEPTCAPYHELDEDAATCVTSDRMCGRPGQAACVDAAGKVSCDPGGAVYSLRGTQTSGTRAAHRCSRCGYAGTAACPPSDANPARSCRSGGMLSGAQCVRCGGHNATVCSAGPDPFGNAIPACWYGEEVEGRCCAKGEVLRNGSCQRPPATTGGGGRRR